MPGFLRWGIIGAGDASGRFAQGLQVVSEAQFTAVWTRRPIASQAFAAEYGGTSCRSLEELLASPLDAVFIGTHPDSHRTFALAALAAGKHVLCEKPSMLNERELEEVLLAARVRGLFFMEAMKAPFFPLYRRLREHLEEDPIGPVGFVRAGSSLADIPAGHPIFDVNLGGGSIMGIAPYEAFLALDWLGPVLRTDTIGRLGPTGVDIFASIQTTHQNGIAQLYCGLGLHGHGDALISGTLGNVAIPAKWWNPEHATVRYLDGRVVEIDAPFISSGFNYEAEHFCELLRSDLTESPIMSHDVSRQMIRILDDARASLGLVYPQEQDMQAPALKV